MDAEILVPVITPFTAEGRLDLDGYIANLHRLATGGVDGAVLMGSSGEFPHLTHSERRQLIQAVSAQRPAAFKILVHAGGGAVDEVAELVQDTVATGLDGALVITPFYFQPQLQRQALTGYYRHLMGFGPIYLYHYPRFTGVTLAAEWVAELAEEGLSGIKDSSGQTAFFAELRALTRQRDFRLYTGSGSAFLAALCQGAAGGIMALAQLAPAELIRIRELWLAGQLEEAGRLQDRLVALDQATGARFGIAGLKWAAHLAGLVSSQPRRPLVALAPEAEAVLSELFTAATAPSD